MVAAEVSGELLQLALLTCNISLQRYDQRILHHVRHGVRRFAGSLLALGVRGLTLDDSKLRGKLVQLVRLHIEPLVAGNDALRLVVLRQADSTAFTDF